MDAGKREAEGVALLAQAEKKAGGAKSGFLKSLFSGSSARDEEAAELFVKAANSFKLAKAWTRAGDAFMRAAAAYESSSDTAYDAASKYNDAAKAFRNVSPERALPAYQEAIRLYTDAARFNQCARLSKEVAEMQEEAGDSAAALEAYTAAADFFDGEGAKSNANTMRQKVAMLEATAGAYGKAAELFEQIAKDALGNNLLKFGARELLLKAGLCRLCVGDSVGAARAIEGYAGMDSSFSGSREGKLLGDVAGAVDEGDVEAFTNSVYDYDSMSKLDEWKTSILLMIKKSIKDVEDDLT